MNKLNNVVYIEDDAKIRAIEYKSDAYKKGVQEISFVAYDDIDKFKKQCEIEGKKPLHIGDCLCKHPFIDNYYVHIGDLEQVTKDYMVAQIYKTVTALGAKKFEYQETTNSYRTRQIDVEIDAKVCCMVDADMKLKKEEEKSQKNDWKLQYENDGGDCDIARAEKECQYLNPKIRSMIAVATGKNRTKFFNEQISLSSETNELLDVAAKLAIKGGAISLDTKLQCRLLVRTDSTYKMRVEF